MRLKKNKRVVQDLPNEVLIGRPQDERTRAETYKWKYLELKGQMGEATQKLGQLRIQSAEELEREKAISKRRGIQANRLARSLEKEKQRVEEFSDNFDENWKRWKDADG